LCIKLELIKELYYDARPNKSQDSHSIVSETGEKGTVKDFTVQNQLKNVRFKNEPLKYRIILLVASMTFSVSAALRPVTAA